MPKKIESTPPPEPRIIKIFDAASRELEKILRDEENFAKKTERHKDNSTEEQSQKVPEPPDK